MYTDKELTFRTNRLTIRPLSYDDHKAWIEGFENRYPSQYKHDKGKINMNECDETWFKALVDKQQELIKQDDTLYLEYF